MRRLIPTGLATAALAMAGAGAAYGGPHFGTKLTLAYSRGSGAFSGSVKSSNAACKASRKVSLYAVRSGNDPVIGSDKTGGSGQWKLNPSGSVATGDYYAATPAMRLGSGQGVCSNAVSVVTHVS